MPISRADFSDAALAEFLRHRHTELAPLAPPESQHALDLDGLRGDNVRMWIFREGGELLGTIALAALEPGHEELKSLGTAPAARGRGIARALLTFAIADARSRGISRISLETGSQAFFLPAMSLYRAHGFRTCPPFGNYVNDPNSVFLTVTVTGTDD